MDPAPLRTRLGCDENDVSSLVDGEATRLHGGGVYLYHCDAGTRLAGSSVIVCDGQSWNDSKPVCHGEYWRDIVQYAYSIIYNL